MDARKLDRIQRDIAAARRRVVTYSDLVSIATSLRRKKLKAAGARGKEPAFVSIEFPNARPISIPFHGNNASIARGTAKNILNDLEGDVFRFRERLRREAEDDYVQENGGYEN